MRDANGRNRCIILRRIDLILAELEQLGTDYIQQALPLHYKDGADEALRQLRHVQGFGDIEDAFGTIHTEAIAELAGDAALRFANALAGVKRRGCWIVLRMARGHRPVDDTE